MSKEEEYKYDFSTKKLALKSIWYFIWEDGSIYSWILNVILAFVIIKFLLFPGLSLIFGTQFPIVAVVSESMEHDGNFDQWWTSPACTMNNPCIQQQWYEKHNITKEQFKEFPFKNGFNKGDVMILWGVEPDKVKLGDIIVFDSIRRYPIIHRAINIEEGEKRIFQTKGDHNTEMISDYYVKDATNNLYKCYIQRQDIIIPSPCHTGAKLVTKKTPGAVKGLDEFEIQEEELFGRAVLRVPYIGYVKIIAVDGLMWVLNLF